MTGSTGVAGVATAPARGVDATIKGFGEVLCMSRAGTGFERGVRENSRPREKKVGLTFAYIGRDGTMAWTARADSIGSHLFSKSDAARYLKSTARAITTWLLTHEHCLNREEL